MNRQASYRPGSGWNLTSLLRDAGAAWRLLWDPKVPGLLKLMLPALAMLYWIWPLDLIPGLPIDDLAIFLLAARLLVALAPSDSVNRAFGNRRSPHRPDDADVIDTTWRVVDE